MRFSTRVVLAVALSAAPASAFQSVHVLSGGIPTALQDAINTSADGDTVLVHGGHYAGIIVNAKSITIVAEPELGTVVDGLVVASVGPSQQCVIAGLDVVSAGLTSALSVQNCSGSVRFEGFRARGLQNSSVDGASVGNCSDVAFVRCELSGANQKPTPGPDLIIYPVGRGLIANASQIALYDTTAFGGRGQDSHFINSVFWSVPAGVGGAGIEIDTTATVFAGHLTTTGGDGGYGRATECIHLPCGFGPTPGGDGGPGVRAAAGTQVVLLDSPATGGFGGLGGAGGQCCGTTIHAPAPPGAHGPPTSGPVTPVAGTSTVLVAESVLRELNSLGLAVSGAAGDTVYLGSSTQSQWTLDLGQAGTLLVGLSSRPRKIGTIPGSGMLQVNVPIAALPPGVGAENRYLQIFVRTPAGQTRLGSPATLTILDSIY